MGLKLAYIGLSILMIGIIIIIGSKAIRESFPNKTVAKRKQMLLVGFLLLWQVYIFGIGSTGILQNFEFPPRFVLLLILPAFLFTGIFIYKNRNNPWINHIPERWLIYYQTFRLLIETIFVFSVAQGILHYQVTIEGYNYDMIFALSAPIIAYLIFQKKMFTKKIMIYWNFLGLLVIASIIFLFMTTLYAPQLYGSDTPLVPKAFVSYPYILVAGFLMPSAVFMHVLSIVQLSRKNILTVDLQIS